MDEDQLQKIVSKTANGEMSSEDASSQINEAAISKMNNSVSDNDTEIHFESTGEVERMMSK